MKSWLLFSLQEYSAAFSYSINKKKLQLDSISMLYCVLSACTVAVKKKFVFRIRRMIVARFVSY